MHESPVSKLGFLAAFFISLVFIIASSFSDDSQGSFIVFCDVGQGDASYIHIHPKLDILIDAGKDSSVLNCLGKYMPAGDKVIELAFISHLQFDHYGGYFHVLKKYQIIKLFLSNPKTTSTEIIKFRSFLKMNKLTTNLIYADESIVANKLELKMLWPSKDYVQASSSTDDPNNSSQILLATFNKHSILYTGDASPNTLKRLLRQAISKVEILKIPHHGSKNGLIYEFLVLADPTYGVISVGKKNSYGHPSPEILGMLKKNRKQILRTDILGDIKFSLD